MIIAAWGDVFVQNHLRWADHGNDMIQWTKKETE